MREPWMMPEQRPDHQRRFLPGWWIAPLVILGIVVWLFALIGVLATIGRLT